MAFLELAKNLRNFGDIYGVQFPLKRPNGQPVKTVEDIAEVCLEEILSIAGSQKIHLLGLFLWRTRGIRNGEAVAGARRRCRRSDSP